MGALTYHPPVNRDRADNAILNLHELASLSQQIFAGNVTEILPLLLRAGGSPGGARPKILVGYNSQNRIIIAGDDILPTGYITRGSLNFQHGKIAAMQAPWSIMHRFESITFIPCFFVM